MWKQMTYGYIKVADTAPCDLSGCSKPAAPKSKYCSTKCRVKNAHRRAKERGRRKRLST